MPSLNFLGKGINFPFRFSSTGGLKKTLGVSIASDIAKINASVRFIISIHIGERPMLRDFGCPNRSLVFEPNDQTLEARIEFILRNAIGKWERRIVLNNLKVDRTLAADGILFLSITYTIIKTNVVGNLVYPFYLQGGLNTVIRDLEVELIPT